MIKKRKSRVLHLSILLAIAVLFIAGVVMICIPIVKQETQLHSDAREYEELVEVYRRRNTTHPSSEQTSEAAITTPESTQETPVIPTPTPDVTRTSMPAKGKTDVDLAACKATNEDFVAWLQIPGTKVNYPVVLTDDADYYLTHTFTGKESSIGTLFSLGKTDYGTPGRNIAIYGHHVQSSGDKMFKPLLDYKKKSFYENHKIIYLDSLFHSETYEVFAVINMVKDDWDPSTAVFADDNVFLDFIHRAKSQALYDTGIEVRASDKTLTLITCDRSYASKDGRLVVMAVCK